MPYDQAKSIPNQRARGAAMFAAQRAGGTTKLRDLSMSGSTKLLFPRHDGPALQAVFLNSAGGVTGGDAFDLSVELDAGAQAQVTSQAAERIYAALPGQTGRVDTRLRVGAKAHLHWLPQETILFDRAALSRRLSVDMAEDATCLMCETLVFGRALMGEVVTDLTLADRIDLRRAGAMVCADRLRLEGDAHHQLAQRFVAGGAGAIATLILAAPQASARLADIRAVLPEGSGASALDPDLVFARLLATDSFELRHILMPLLSHLTGGALPRPWMI